jgi:hypothetical protein
MHGMSVKKQAHGFDIIPFYRYNEYEKLSLFATSSSSPSLSCNHAGTSLPLWIIFGHSFPFQGIFPSFLLLGSYLNIPRNDESPRNTFKKYY